MKLVSYIISPMLPVITCKRPRSKIPHGFPTVLKCLSTSQLRETVKYEISGNFPPTWSVKIGWLFQKFQNSSRFSHSFKMFECKPGIQYHPLLAKRKASFRKRLKFTLIAIGFEQFYEFQNMTSAFLQFLRIWFGFFSGFRGGNFLNLRSVLCSYDFGNSSPIS